MTANPYAPDDARFTLPALEFLRGDDGRKLRAAIAQLPNPQQPSVAEVARLRKQYPPDAVRVALMLAAIQDKGRAKFPEQACIWSPPEALEQATSTRVARHKATTFADAMSKTPDAPLFDLCCGIGGDAIALADVAPVHAIDLSPIRTACLHLNLSERPAPRHSLNIRVADVRAIAAQLPPNAAVHIDPARRSSGRRSPSFDDLIPGPDLIGLLARRPACTAIKLSPAVEFDALPPGHLELYSENGIVVQAVLWTGEYFARSLGSRTAILLSDRQAVAFRFNAVPAQPRLTPLPFEIGTPIQHPPHYLYELDGALTRSGLAAPFLDAHALSALTTDGGYAMSTALVHAPAGLTAFQIFVVYPFSERRIAAELAALPPAPKSGNIEVKTRGRLPGVDTDHLQVTWSRAARAPWTVLIFRHGKEVYAAIAQRL